MRGWLTGISGKCYGEDIYYNSGNGTPLYNGNISSVIWRDSTQTASRGYKFTYDSMNRLTDAVYGEGPSLSDNTDRYSERGMTYTKNGALTRLLRYGRRNTDDFGLVDSLAMTLDGNGSLSVDPYKGFAFEYDLLGNLKRTESEYTTSYVYSSTGERLSVKSKFNGCIIKPHPVFPSDWEEGGVIFNATSDDSGDSDIMDRWKKAGVPRDTEFCGPFIFEYSVLDKFLFDGGYCTFKDGQASFHYYLQDLLGNNRAVVSEDGTVEQTTEYYPFGGIYGDVSTNPGLQLYKYNGKEFDHSLSLDLYDYGAHLYDPALVVWTGVDPLADEYGGISPYVYCLSNPVKYIDPNGKKVVVWYRNKQGEYCQFIFTGFHGKNYIVYPINQFVADFLQAYLYNVRNGGGDKMKEAVLNDKYKIYVDDAANLDEYKTFFSPGRQPTIYWESRKGLKNSYGGKQSPATRLEHEFDHAIDNINNSHNHRIRREEADAQYDNKEEKRVITGSERKTARANKEDIRYNHKGKTFDVSGSTKVY